MFKKWLVILDDSLRSINLIPTNVFWPPNCDRGWGWNYPDHTFFWIYPFCLFLLDCKFYFFFFFFAFQLFVSFNGIFITFIMGIFYFTLVWRDLKAIKFKKMFFFTSDKYAVKNNPLMQLSLIIHKTEIKFQSLRLLNFSAIKKTVTELEGNRGG